ncbi:MAG: hypothetical protein WC557_01650 [Ignavibacteriaceae bacterium]
MNIEQGMQNIEGQKLHHSLFLARPDLSVVRCSIFKFKKIFLPFCNEFYS